MPYIYGPDGEFKGSVSTIGPSELRELRIKAHVVGLMILIALGYWLWDVVSLWKHYGQPYGYIAAYYYYLIVVPLSFVADVWGVASDLTDYKNLNLVIGSVLVFLYVVVVLPGALIASFLAFDRINIDRLWFPAIWGPAVFAGIWYLGSVALIWLFAR